MNLELDTDEPSSPGELGIYALFPTAAKFCQLPRDFTKAELDYISNLEQINNNNTNTQSENAYVLEHPILQSLRKFCEQEIDSYFRQIIAPREKVDCYITQSWVNYAPPGGSHVMHVHPNSVISGVLYICASEKVDLIEFQSPKYWSTTLQIPSEKFNSFNCISWNFPVWTGALVLFPSDLLHSVPPTRGTHTRISLSFNTFVRGELGGETEKTQLFIP